MAISMTDCLTLLVDIHGTGVDTDDMVREVVKNSVPTVTVLKFINDHRQLDLTRFYEKIRKNCNNHKSPLYRNIMRGPDVNDITSTLTTLNSYALQVVLFSKEVTDKQLFFKFARLSEVYKCLYQYSQTFDLTNCITLLNLITADIKALESCYRMTPNQEA